MAGICWVDQCHTRLDLCMHPRMHTYFCDLILCCPWGLMPHSSHQRSLCILLITTALLTIGVILSGASALEVLNRYIIFRRELATLRLAAQLRSSLVSAGCSNSVAGFLCSKRYDAHVRCFKDVYILHFHSSYDGFCQLHKLDLVFFRLSL